MRVGFLTIALLMACGGAHKRPPLEEVPIGTMPGPTSGDVTSAPMPTVATQTPTAATLAPSASQAVPPKKKKLK